MGRKVAMLWHASFSIGAGVLFFYFVLPRWPELVGDVAHGVGNVLRIVTGAVIGLAALPVVFTLLRTRKPELATPQLALTIRTWSIVAHVLAGVLIVGTAISEYWLSLDKAGQWLFAIYGAAAAVAVLGFFAFYLSFAAELPPPPPKPIKPKKDKKRGVRGKKRGKAVDVDEDSDDDELDDDTDAVEETEDADTDADAEAETVEAPATVTLKKDESPEPEAVAGTAKDVETADDTVAAKIPGESVATEEATEPEEAKESEDAPESPAPDSAQPRLRNRRPTGKTSHRRRRTRGGVAVEE